MGSTFLTDAMNRLTCFLFLATIVYVVEGYSSGAPDTACGDMFPAGHNTPAQTSKSPYILDMKIEMNKDGTTEKVKVEIKRQSPQQYGTAEKGFFLQMRDARTNKPVGVWEENEIAKGVACNGMAGSALTHKNSDDKKGSLVFTWKMPKGEGYAEGEGHAEGHSGAINIVSSAAVAFTLAMA